MVTKSNLPDFEMKCTFTHFLHYVKKNHNYLQIIQFLNVNTIPYEIAILRITYIANIQNLLIKISYKKFQEILKNYFSENMRSPK